MSVSYLCSFNRYVKQANSLSLSATTAVAVAIAEALNNLKTAAWKASLWTVSGTFPDHTGELIGTSDAYDAYAFCGDHDATSGAHRAYVGMVAYRIALPAVAYASGSMLSGVTVSVAGDPYLTAGARLAVKLSASANPDPDWATLTQGAVDQAAVAPRTSTTSGTTTKWFGANTPVTLQLGTGSGVQALQYVWIYLSLEDYLSCTRMPWIEGGAALLPTVTLTFVNALTGFNAGDNIGGRVNNGDVALARTSILTESFGYYMFLTGSGGLNGIERVNAIIGNFGANCALVESSGTYALTVGLYAGVFFYSAGSPNVSSVFAGVLPCSMHLPAGMPFNSLKVSAPAAWSGCSFIFSAYWVEGDTTTAGVKAVPSTDIGFWMGKTAATTIGGKPAVLLGRAVLSAAPVSGTISIPVSWKAVTVDKQGSIYLVVMPVDVTVLTGSLASITVAVYTTAVSSPFGGTIGAVAPWQPALIAASSDPAS